MRFKDLKLGTKQRIGFGIILVLMAGVNIFSLYNMANIKKEIDDVTQNWLPRAIAISDINLISSELRRTQLQTALATDETARQQLNLMTVEQLTKIEENQDIYKELRAASEQHGLYSEEEAKLYAKFDQEWESYLDLSIAFFKHIRNNENAQAIEILNGKAQDVFEDFSKDLVELVNVNKRDSFQAAERAENTYKATLNISIGILLGSVILSAFIVAGLVRFITVPVEQLEKAAGKVAEGDLNVQLGISSKDEIGSLAGSFNEMTTSLRNAKIKTERQAHKLKAQNKELARAMRELRSTQEQLMMKEKMAALGDLVAGLAHEINNPIGAMNSSADVCARCIRKIEHTINQSKSISKDSGEALASSLTTLRNNIEVTLMAGDRIATIVKSLRNFARLDEAEYQRADIREGIDSSLTLLESEFQERISIIKEYHDIPKIPCYPGQLNQVFMSLLRNASQSITESGTIKIRTFTQNGDVHVEFSDNGKGIPSNRLKRLFDFGFSEQGSRVKMTSGLSTAYNIIQKHNGEIRVTSKVGKGSTFLVILPVKASQK